MKITLHKSWGILLFFVIITATGICSETEPNDDPVQANLLQLDKSNTGTLGYNGDKVDWWKVTVPADGKLVIVTNSDAALEIDNYIYDQDGVTQIAGYAYGGTHIWDTCYVSNVAPGTYYIKTDRYSGLGAYTINSHFIPANYQNDSEVNDSASAAVKLDLNSTLTGHLGFFNLGKVDNVDWYKITVPVDGKLVVATQSDPTLEIDNFIYDSDKKKQIATYAYGGTHTWDTTYFSNLLPGTYYIKSVCYSGYGSYKITNTLIPAAYVNDTEVNDSVEAAIPFDINSSSTGHLGYYSAGYSDLNDWRKIIVPSDSKLVVATLSEPTLEIDNSIYDSDKKKQIATYAYGGSHTWDTTYFNYLLPGTYYVKSYCWSGYGSYTINNKLIPAKYNNDPEPNDALNSAKNIAFNTIITGHSGYYGNGYTDENDYFSFNIPAALDTLFIRTDSDSTLEIDLNLYNEQGVVIGDGSVYGTEEMVIQPGAKSGNYFVQVEHWSGGGSYKLLVTDTRPVSLLVVDVKEKPVVRIPARFELLQNYPNPFNPVTKISYGLISDGQATLKIYDLLGREVKTLVNEYKGKGFYNVEFNAADLSSGIYFYRLTQNNNVMIKKMLLLK